MIEMMTKETEIEKIKVISPEIIVTMMGTRPYYEIKYFDISDCKWHIGYSSYKLENVIEWKNECFEVIDTNDKWIPCSERLPNCNGCYLVWRPHFFGGEIGMPAICYFDGQNTWHDSYGVDFTRILNKEDVPAWMPLPEPYKGE